MYVYTETKMIPTIYILYFLPKKQCARISIEKTIRKRPQNTLARRVVRRKEEEKEKKKPFSRYG